MNCGIMSFSGPDVKVLPMLGMDRYSLKAVRFASPLALVRMERSAKPSLLSQNRATMFWSGELSSVLSTKSRYALKTSSCVSRSYWVKPPQSWVPGMATV